VEPLVEHEVGGRWALLLVNRTVGRILRGSRDRLAELPPLIDEVHGQHDQGGWSQARYQRSVEKEVYDHLARVADALFGSFKRSPFDRLLVGCTEELYPEIVDRLHSDLRRRLAGRLQIDVRNPTPEQVLEIAHPAMENDEREHEEELLQRMQQGAGAGGRGAVGVEDVVGALNERRVEALLVTPDFSAEGSRCPTCGWLATDGASRCPAEGTALERLPGLREGAIEAAVRQAAEVIVVRDRPDLEPFGGIGAVLRF
jgi:peptide subunit release factor 1 (eRF1)